MPLPSGPAERKAPQGPLPSGPLDRKHGGGVALRSTDDEAEVRSASPGEQAAASDSTAQGNKYTFFVGPGNNSELVRQTFERRAWWELGKEDDPELNLKWLQVRSKPVADAVRKAGSKQFLNHLDGLQCIGRKNELYVNLRSYCERERLDVHSMAPPTFIVSAGEACSEYNEFARICKAMDNKIRASNARTDVKGPTSPSKKVAGTDDSASEASTQIAEVKSPSKGKKDDGGKSPRKNKPGATRGDAIGSINTAGTSNIWIVKPTNNNRGNGIKVFNTFQQIDEHLRKKSLGTAVVVQKYIERPLLYKGRKFDIRQLVLVDNNMNIYVYKEFYVRTSTTAYDIDNMQDLFIHLTNYAVQKKKKKGKPERELDEDEMDEDDEAQEEGNNLSMEELNEYLEAEGYPMNCAGVMKRIHDIVTKLFLAVWRKLDPLREKNTFEIFGLDFLLDEEMNVWVIEVNTNPYIGECA